VNLVSITLPDPIYAYVVQNSTRHQLSVSDMVRHYIMTHQDFTAHERLAERVAARVSRKTTTTVVNGDDPGDQLPVEPIPFVEHQHDPLDPDGYWLTHVLDIEGRPREPGRAYSYDGWPLATSEEQAEQERQWAAETGAL
jgi:hypothetical protein